MRDPSPRTMTLGQLFDGFEITSSFQDWRAVTVSGLSLDSRQIEPGDLYLALPGRSSHGLDHAAHALERGALAVAVAGGELVNCDGDARQLEPVPRRLIEVASLDTAIAMLASRFFDAPDKALRLVAVTGTDGKTSVCRFVAEAFSRLGKPSGYIGTLGWGLVDGGPRASDESHAPVLHDTALTTPDAVALPRMLRALVDAGAVTVALEASSHGLAEGRLDGLAIDIAVLTNLGRDHLDYHIDVQAYAAAKSRLFDWPTLSGRVLNADDRLGRALVSRGGGIAAAFRFSSASADRGTGLEFEHRLSDLECHAHGLGFRIEEIDADGTARAGRVDSELFGRFNAQNLAACFGVLRLCRIDFAQALDVLSALPPVAGRMERVVLERADSGCLPTVIVDFAHTPEALGAAIEAARAHCGGRLCVVFGCGGDRDPGKRVPMAKAARLADRVVVTDDNPRTEDPAAIIATILEGFGDDDCVSVVGDRRAAIVQALESAAASDVVLIAGKGHEDYQIVGVERRDFSDREIARAALARRAADASARAGSASASSAATTSAQRRAFGEGRA